MTHTKVFVGNLSFKTKAEELASEFTVAGRVVSANIITRGPRSLGYGFVEMETEAEAQKAVALLNKKSVDSREINVELAKPREDKPHDRSSRPPRGRGGMRRGRRGPRGPRGPSDGGNAPSNNNNNNAPNNNNNAPNNNNNSGAPSNNNNNNNNSGAPRTGPRRRYNNNRGPSNAGGAGGAGGGGAGGGGYRPRRRFTRPRNQPDTRTPSPTTLFVANLPFSVDDEALSKLFKDHKAIKAHVVKNRNQRSKGFGFVEFANEADQKAALAATEKLSVEGRDLIVKIALTAPEIVNKDAAAAPKDSSSAPAPAPVAAAAKDTPKETPKTN